MRGLLGVEQNKLHTNNKYLHEDIVISYYVYGERNGDITGIMTTVSVRKRSPNR